ncbi:MAG: molybdopterin-dependent oxidoreductase [Acidobacteria bacterium]|nr:molybdopterin-dependent oxidoreductase [Acidobacteriota bacterium]
MRERDIRHTFESGLTADALTRLHVADISRRRFLHNSGAVVVAFATAALAERAGVAPGVASAQGGNTPQTLDSWIRIDAGGHVTAYTGRAEFGQGMATVQAQLVAEELSVPMDRVTLVQCDTALTPDQGTSSGSQAHPVNFNHGNLALAGATAREALFEMAAGRLGVPVEQLTVVDGVITPRGDTGRGVTYGDLIGGQRFNMTLKPQATRKPPGSWTTLGTSVPRLDLADLVTGRFEFVDNVRVPEMVYGQVIRPPVIGATLVRVDEGSVSGSPGVLQVVVRNNFVGVVAETLWQAIQAANRLRVTWSEGRGLPTQREFYDHLRYHPTRRSTLVVNADDVDAKLSRAVRVLESTYLHPYQMHGAMGSSCAVADVRGSRATIWSATQAVYPLRDTTAMVLGLSAEDVRVIFVRGSGCYGINGADTVSYDAALMSQAVGRPVRVQLSREQEMAWGENYGLPYVIDQRAGVDASGDLVAWDVESWSGSLGDRPGYDRPGNVVTGALVGFEPVPLVPRAEAPEPTQFANRGNAAPSYVTGRVGPTAGGTGTVKGQRVVQHVVPSPFFTGPLRSPRRLQNTFAHESFMDEIASAVRADPVEYRVRHLADARLREVVTEAARAANWETRPSPRPDRPRTGVVSGRGIACVLYEGDNGYVALVAEVDVDRATGDLAATRFVTALDVGPISNPDGVRNQLEGGILQGLSRAVGEEVTWDSERITSVDWATYKSLFLPAWDHPRYGVGSRIPVIETVLINRPDGEAMGAGETAITLVAAAVGNAIFDATGARLREVPFTPERVRAALSVAQ